MLSPARIVGATVVAAAAVLACAACGPSAAESLTAPTPAVASSPAASAPTDSTEPAATQAAPSSQEPAPAPAPVAGAAADLLATLPVKGRAPKTGYDRDQFGQAWADVDRNGCDTRNDILTRDLTEETFKPGTRDCVVLSGNLADPYTGTVINFQRGQDTSNAVQIDHVVALSNAWQTGAQQLDAATRQALANDPLNLLAVDGPTNGQKSDSDAATWLPPNKAIRCQYVARQVAVKAKYQLWVTPPEKDAISRVLSACPGEPVPAASSTAGVTTAPAAIPAPASEPAPAVAGGDDPQFGSCKAATAAGYGPYTVGVDPEASWYRDGDGDGVVCE